LTHAGDTRQAGHHDHRRAPYIKESGLKNSAEHLVNADPLAPINFAGIAAQDAATPVSLAATRAQADEATWREMGDERPDDMSVEAGASRAYRHGAS